MPSAVHGLSGNRPPADCSLKGSLRLDADGDVVLGGKGPAASLPTETWRDIKGICAPNFQRYPRADDGVWICVRPFLQALLTEAAMSIFRRKDEERVTLLGNTMRVNGSGTCREVLDVVEDVGSLAGFMGRFADEMDEDVRLCKAVGELLLATVAIEQLVDEHFDKMSDSDAVKARGWRNAEYCRRWNHAPAPIEYKTWRAEQTLLGNAYEDDPLLSYEFFACLPRVRPGISDSEAAKRRVGYKGRDRHVVDIEGDVDACGKSFFVKTGLTQGVFNVVCPHVITYGFRCLFQAESVGDALSVILERFPRLPRVIFYDVACKIDKNSMRRVRTIFRQQGVRCILDRPHSITHSCSPVHMPDESLGTTSGVATQAAEVSHSISVVHRTSLAYMSAATYMVHRMVQVAFMNLRKLYRLHTSDVKAESDHVPLAPFFRSKILHQCERAAVCASPRPVAVVGADGNDAQEGEDMLCVAAVKDFVPDESLAAHVSADDGGLGTSNGDSELDSFLAVGVGTLGHREARDKVGEVAATPSTSTRATRTAGMALIADALAAHEKGAERELPAAATPLATTFVSAKLRRLLAAIICSKSSVAVRPSNKGRIRLLLSDLRRLCGSSWLDDELVNFFVALTNDLAKQLSSGSAAAFEGLDEPNRRSMPRTCMFNTFFMSLLSARVGCYEYTSVRRWGLKMGLDLAAVDTILVPVNLRRTHWVLASIDVKNRSFTYYDSFGSPDSSSVVRTLRRWLCDEVRARVGDDAVAAWDVFSWPLRDSAGLPRQLDGSSCGVFTPAAADWISLGMPLAFEQADMPTLRCRVALSLFFDDLRCSAGLSPSGGECSASSGDDDASDEDIPTYLESSGGESDDDAEQDTRVDNRAGDIERVEIASSAGEGAAEVSAGGQL